MVVTDGPVPFQLTAEDVPRVDGLFRRCADYFLLQDGVAPSRSDAEALFTQLPEGRVAADQQVLGWPCGNHGEDIIAIAAILPDYPEQGIWYLGLLLIDPAFRGRGFGTQIHREIALRSEAQGAREIRLAVLATNRDARQFWYRQGFEQFRSVGPDRFKTRRHRRVELRRLLV